MRYICFALTCIALLGSAVACNAPINHDAQKEARDGLDTAVQQIPSILDFTVVKIVYREFYDNEDPSGKVAYFARAFFVIGTSITPETLANDVYAKKIQELGLGWRAREDPPDLDLMFRGKNEKAVVSFGSVDPIVESAVDLSQIRSKYQSVIFLELENVVIK